MDKDKLLFTSPDFYRFATQGLIEEATRRIKEREPISEIEEWITICDQLAQAIPDEVEEVITSLLDVSYDTVMDLHESEPEQPETTGTDTEEENTSFSNESQDETPEETVATTPVEESVHEEESLVPRNQDPFELHSFKNMSGDIFGDLSKEMGLDFSKQEDGQ